MNNFDDRLRENVKKAFSNYNSDHLADEGWDSFVALHKGRRKRAVLIPLWARAASILLIIGFGAFLAWRLSVPGKTREIISSAEPVSGKNQEKVAPVTTPPSVSTVSDNAEKPVLGTGHAVNTAPGNQPAVAFSGQSRKKDQPFNDGVIQQDPEEIRFINNDILPVSPVATALTGLYGSSAINGLRSGHSRSAIIESEDSEGINEMPDPENSSRGTRFLAGLSGSMARAGEESSPVSGMSMGFYLSRKIAGRFSVRPGLALAMQSFGLENSEPPMGVAYNIPLYDGTNGTPHSSEGRFSMVAIELPVNLVVTLFERKRSGFFISAGTSSLFYISQQLKADFVNKYTKMDLNALTGQYTTATMFSTVEVEKEYDSFSRADFFGLANLSAGYSFPYSKTGTMLVEPFVQLPVNDLTSLNLRIRYAGVSMKLQFGKREQEK